MPCPAPTNNRRQTPLLRVLRWTIVVIFAIGLFAWVLVDAHLLPADFADRWPLLAIPLSVCAILLAIAQFIGDIRDLSRSTPRNGG